MLPSATMNIDDITPIAFKTRKEKVTLNLFTNMAGSDKLIPLEIGKYKKPRCFKNQSILPVKYTSNSASWVTRAIFDDWLLQWNRKLARESRKVCLIVDNCRCHIDLKSYSQIKVEYLPKNSTALLQQLDQGIIGTVKAYYRSLMDERILEMMELVKQGDANSYLEKLSLLDDLHIIDGSWGKVSTETIVLLSKFRI